MKKNVNVLFSILAAMTVICVFAMGKSNKTHIISNNVAGTYVDYTTKGYIDWSTGGMMLSDKYMYKYHTSYTEVASGTTESYVYSYQGPTPMEHQVTLESGTKRTTTVTSSAEFKWFKLAAAYNCENSKSCKVSQKFIFPGDNKMHTLYQTCKTFGKRGFVRREAYKSTVKSYTYIWGVCAWNVEYTEYVRSWDDDYSNRQACDTVEKQYGAWMR